MRTLARRPPTDRPTLLKAVHATAREVGMEEEARRTLQQQLTGRTSCKEMDIPQLQQVYRALSIIAQGLPGATHTRRTKPKLHERAPDEPPTLDQLELVEHLFDHLGIRPSSDMMAISRKITGYSWPQSRLQAGTLIEGLKQMDKRKWRPKGLTT